MLPMGCGSKVRIAAKAPSVSRKGLVLLIKAPLIVSGPIQCSGVFDNPEIV